MAAKKNNVRLHQQMSSYFLSSLTSAITASDLIAAQLDKLPEEQQSPELRQYLAILRRSQFQMLRMAENMRELTGLTEGTLQLHRDTVDLDRLCADLVEGVQALLPEIKISYKGPDMTCITYCDPERIERLLLNLLANSLLHCGEGGAVRLLLQRTADTLQIVVSDNGSGIPREKMEHLFSDYLRGPDLSEQGRGAGIGLGVAEQIARAHGGSLVISSEEGHGTKAVFSLPHAYSGELRAYREPWNGRMRSILTGLADVLDAGKFMRPYL